MIHQAYLTTTLTCVGMAITLVMASPLTAQHSVRKYLISNGGNAATSVNNTFNGSLGQPVIGIVQRHPKHLEQGFWYGASRIHDANGWHTTVTLPQITGRNGQTIEIPITMVSTQKMFVAGVKHWTARIRFNKSMLEPRDLTTIEEADKHYIVTLKGRATDTIQRLASFRAFVRLGNDTATDLTFESFTWDEPSRMRIYAENGLFTDLSICKAGGPRLTAVAGHPILRVMPQPITDKGEVICDFGQAEDIQVVIYDGNGTAVRELFTGSVPAGEFRLPFTTMDLAAGPYVMSVRTRWHSVAEQFIIVR
ncbi:MAG: hypothetical protein FGM33_03440 [Candidatus Kapabacteria bacterium]|nr:hypothetical protein [Candidatus Kapabacteria bacterium]